MVIRFENELPSIDKKEKYDIHVRAHACAYNV